MGLITLVVVGAGHPIIAVAEYLITLLLVIALVMRPCRIKHGILYLKHNLIFTRRMVTADIVAIEKSVQPPVKTMRLVRFDIVLRDG